MEPLNFVCWLWSTKEGTLTTKKPIKYIPEDVNSLYEMLKKHYHKPFNLLCVTDNPEGIHLDIKIIPLWEEFRELGFCFTRLVCFKKGMDKIFGERFVSIDLDCVIVGDITSLFDTDVDFCIWSHGINGEFCGSLWLLKTNTHSEVYETFDPSKLVPNSKGRYSGGSDQAQMKKAIPHVAFWNEAHGVYAFRNIRDEKELPNNSKIIFFNGNYHPRQSHIRYSFPWIANNYPVKITENYDPVTIVCFYWRGNIRSGWSSSDMASKYVNTLYASIRRNYNFPFRFVCIHEDGVHFKELFSEVELIPFQPKGHGRIPKLKMFDKELWLSGRIITMDLDVIITGCLDELFTYKGDFMTRASFKDPTVSGGDIIFFDSEKTYPLWDYVLQDHPIIKNANGNERMVYREYFKDQKIDYIQDLFPGSILSYRTHIRHGRIPNGCSLISCHGNPRPHMIFEKSIRKYWNDRL